MNRQRDAWGENASHGQSDEEGVEAEAGSLGSQQAKQRKPRAKACGKDETHSSIASLSPHVFYLRRGEP